jgi:hypothetical protein
MVTLSAASWLSKIMAKNGVMRNRRGASIIGGASAAYQQRQPIMAKMASTARISRESLWRRKAGNNG